MRQRQKDLPLRERCATGWLRSAGVQCALLWSALLWSALLLLCSCVPGRASSVATATATATLTPTPTLEGLPTPVATLLDPAPTNCPNAPPLQTMTFAQFGGFQGSVTFHGNPPVWIADGYFPTVLNLNPYGYDPWPGTKIVWEVGPNYTETVQVEATNLATGKPAWWGQGGPIAQSRYGAAQALVLDPTHTGPGAAYHGPPESGWNEWGSFVYLLQAGCYALDATWPGGHWRTIFAAGR